MIRVAIVGTGGMVGVGVAVGVGLKVGVGVSVGTGLGVGVEGCVGTGVGASVGASVVPGSEPGTELPDVRPPPYIRVMTSRAIITTSDTIEIICCFFKPKDLLQLTER